MNKMNKYILDKLYDINDVYNNCNKFSTKDIMIADIRKLENDNIIYIEKRIPDGFAYEKKLNIYYNNPKKYEININEKNMYFHKLVNDKLQIFITDDTAKPLSNLGIIYNDKLLRLGKKHTDQNMPMDTLLSLIMKLNGYDPQIYNYEDCNYDILMDIVTHFNLNNSLKTTYTKDRTIYLESEKIQLYYRA